MRDMAPRRGRQALSLWKEPPSSPELASEKNRRFKKKPELNPSASGNVDNPLRIFRGKNGVDNRRDYCHIQSTEKNGLHNPDRKTAHQQFGFKSLQPC